jgi:hypothetical protein
MSLRLGELSSDRMIPKSSPLTTGRYAMTKLQAVRQRIAAAIALLAIVLAFALDARSAVHADTEPDFLVLDPERE